MGCNSSSNLTPVQKRRLEAKKKGINKSQPIPTQFEEVDPLKLIAKLEVPILLGSDFIVENYVASGGEGRVYAATRSTDGKRVALKFFGYEAKIPELENILNEIHISKALSGIEGIVGFDGIFMDTVTGIIPGKKHRKPFPVIVMEILSGGELFDRIQIFGDMNEAVLANVFRHVVITMQEMHNRCYIHRDLKLENLMYVSKEPDSLLKIIDFGMMAKIKTPTSTFKDVLVDGTAGYVAPESFRKMEYSAKSDVFQAGCCLYSMLSGLAAFDPNIPDECLHKPYRPTVGRGWDNISPAAKDLISHLLVINPSQRYSTQEILQHPWLNGSASETSLDSSYFERVKQLALRQKLRKFFTEINIEELSKSRRASLTAALPFLDPVASKKKQKEMEKANKKKNKRNGLDDLSVSRHGVMVARKGDELSMSTHGGHKTKDIVMDPEFFTKLKLLKTELIHHISPYKSSTDNNNNNNNSNSNGVDASRVTTGMSTNSIGSAGSARSILSDGDHNIQSDEIPFDTFVALLDDYDLPQLASRDVFDIFDYNEAGVIDIKEFLVTMLAFREEEPEPELSTSPGLASSDTAARLFFRLFDINETGYISMDDLKVVLGCLMVNETKSQISNDAEQHPATQSNIEDLFRAIDVEKAGRIDFEGFKKFYDALLLSGTTTIRRDAI